MFSHVLEKVLPRLAISALEGHICFGLSQNPFLGNKIHKALFARGFHVRYSDRFGRDVVPSMPVSSRPVRSLGPFRLGNKVAPRRARAVATDSSAQPPCLSCSAVRDGSALTDVIIRDWRLQRQATEAGIIRRQTASSRSAHYVLAQRRSSSTCAFNVRPCPIRGPPAPAAEHKPGSAVAGSERSRQRVGERIGWGDASDLRMWLKERRKQYRRVVAREGEREPTIGRRRGQHDDGRGAGCGRPPARHQGARSGCRSSRS